MVEWEGAGLQKTHIRFCFSHPDADDVHQKAIESDKLTALFDFCRIF